MVTDVKLQINYSTTEFADIEKTVVPLWSMIRMKKYASISLPYSRGVLTIVSFAKYPRCSVIKCEQKQKKR